MMSASSMIKRSAAAAIGIALCGFCLGIVRQAQTADAESAAVAARLGPADRDSQYMGADSCALCHAKRDSTGRRSDSVTLEESVVWEHQDRHRHAYDSLKCDGAKQIEKLMGMNPGDAATDRQCLACHAIDVGPDSSGATLNTNETRQAAVEQGVSCEACHGRASRWIDRHWKRGEWRELPKPRDDQRFETYGMTNVRDPVVRAELCVSCHLGNIADGKFVTHEMFAAGHPPLPAFEVETFLEKMPPHWKSTLENSPPLSRTRSVLLEGLVTLRASLKLLADQVDAALSSKVEKENARPGLADFALYDCAACHHELRIPSQRQDRGYFSGTPGRPPLRYWNFPLARLSFAAKSLSDGKAAPASPDVTLAPLYSLLKGHPFGNPRSVRAKAQGIVAELDQAIAALKEKSLDDKQIRRLLELICQIGGESPLDYDSARQVVGAIRVIVTDIEQTSDANSAAKLDSRVKPAIAELEELLRPKTPAGTTPLAGDACASTWDTGAGFKPYQFQDKLKELAELLRAH